MKKLFICAALALTGCSAVSDMDTMTKSTGDLDAKMGASNQTMAGMSTTTTDLDGKMSNMNDTMNGMNTTMQSLNNVTNGMSATTNQLYLALRQGNSETIRAKALEDMEANSAVETKILYAGIYMIAFEFQVWTGEGLDDEARREVLYQDAFIQFDKDMRRYMGATLSLDPTSTDPAMENLYALSATLHMLNPLQEILVKDHKGIKASSMLTLIESVLRKNKELESGKVQWDDLKPYEQEALSAASDLQYIVKLRANFIPALVISKFTNLEYASFTTKIQKLTLGFTADFQDIGLAALYTYRDYMKEANANRIFLKSIGLDPEYNCRLNLLYKGMKMPTLNNVPAPRQQATAQSIDQITEFEEALPQTSLASCLL